MDNIIQTAFNEIDQSVIDLGGIVKLPTVSTEVELSEKTKVFVLGVLAVVAFMVFRPRLRRFRRR